MLAPLGAKIVVVVLFGVVLFPAVFPAVAFNVLVSLAPMLAPLGAKVVVVVLLAPLAFTVELAPVVAFCGKQSDCDCVTFVPVPAGPTDAPPGARVTAVALLPPVACTGLVGADDIIVSNSKRVGKAIVVMNLPYILDLIAVFL
ncbi:MAG TPA: hypothetical protein VI037_02535 [Nitrososphaera sp.]